MGPGLSGVEHQAAAGTAGGLKAGPINRIAMKTSSFMTMGYNRGTERIDPRPSKRVGRCSPTLACRLSRAARGREASHGAGLHGSTPPATGETPALPYASAVGEHSPAEGS